MLMNIILCNVNIANEITEQLTEGLPGGHLPRVPILESV